MLRSEFRTVPSSRPDRVGLIRYQWGFALRLEDSCFAKSDLSPFPIHCRRHRRRRMMLAFLHVPATCQKIAVFFIRYTPCANSLA